MQIEVTDEMREAVRRDRESVWAIERDDAIEDLALLVIAAIEQQEQTSGN